MLAHKPVSAGNECNGWRLTQSRFNFDL